MRPAHGFSAALVRAALVALAVAGIAGALRGGGQVRAGDEGSPTGCVVPVFVEDDATLVRAYDGLRLGLEEANLPRACRAPLAFDERRATFSVASDTVRAAAAAGAPFVVAMGRSAAAAVAHAPFVGRGGPMPRIYVDVTLTLGGVALVALPPREGRHAVVRAEVPVERLAALVRDLLPGRARPTALISWSEPPSDAVAWRQRAEEATGVRFVTDASDRPDVMLDVGSGAGGTSETFALLLARAQASRVPLVSTSRARFGQGAAVVVVPDAALLGRVAAEAARRVLADDVAGPDVPDHETPSAPAAVHLPVRTTEVWVDLEAAAEEGLDPPLAFLARVDRVRRPRAAAPPPSPSKAPR